MQFVVYDPHSLFLLTVSKSIDFVLTSGVNDLHRFSIPFSQQTDIRGLLYSTLLYSTLLYSSTQAQVLKS